MLGFLAANNGTTSETVSIVSNPTKSRLRVARGPDERGFTLIEVTVALVIFTLAVLIAARMQGNAVRSLKRTGETSMAMNLAASTLESLRVEMAFDDIDGTGPNVYYDRFGYGFQNTGLANPTALNAANSKYMVRWNAESRDYYVDVNVAVYWNAGGIGAPVVPSEAKYKVRTVNTRIVNREVFRR